MLELDLSALGLLPNQLADIMTAIEESCVLLQNLNFSYNSLSGDLKNEHSLNFCKKLV